MNVSKQADQNFMNELKRTDRPRYDRLAHIMEKEAARLARLAQQSALVTEIPNRQCKHCGLILSPGQREDALYCDLTCQRNARFAKTGERQSQMAA
jgi:hypothetical protein